ncbi:MAG: 5-oxoprolinase subunit PxpA [Armatimonadota bacterium]|nr:5-oxoprolinase subunit PxpA [Armatimonadota bacterium]MDR5696350.1 5-oxoprolinase subunit PxpA [Armatimonadota bacterium]
MDRHLDINCDVGESFGVYRLGADEAVMPYVTSANVACGMHAGDPVVMRRTVRLARAHGVAVGAHPGYPDLAGFGRRPLPMTPDEVAAFLLAQIGALEAIARAEGVRLQHIKPHGALYNAAARDEELAAAIAESVLGASPDTILVVLAGSAAERAARAAGLRVAREAFCDRAYRSDGSLVPRSEPGAVLLQPFEVASRAVRIAYREPIQTLDGGEIVVEADTVCIHGDTPGAETLAAAVRAALEEAHVHIRPMGEWL